MCVCGLHTDLFHTLGVRKTWVRVFVRLEVVLKKHAPCRRRLWLAFTDV